MEDITGFCELALTGECPHEKKILCIKASHDICLTGKFRESLEEKLKRINDEEKKKYRQPNPHAVWVILSNGQPADIGS